MAANPPPPTFEALGIDLRFTSRLDAMAVRSFVAVNPEERMPRNIRGPVHAELRGTAYNLLAQMLRLLRRRCLLDIIDADPATITNLIAKLRGARFEGAWLDRLQQLVDGNIAHNGAAFRRSVAAYEDMNDVLQHTTERLQWIQEFRLNTEVQVEQLRAERQAIEQARANPRLTQLYTFEEA